MKKIVKLLGEMFPDIIDLFYGIALMWLIYYELFICTAGMLYLGNFIQSNILRSIVREVPIELIGVNFQKGSFSQFVISLFILCTFYKLLCLLFSGAPRRLKMNSVLEIIIGALLVFFEIHRKPIVTPDQILRFICYFMIIKLSLIVLTRIFKIPTGHFGSFKKEMNNWKKAFAVAAVKSEEVSKS
ncbi:hypothetical protein RZO55_10370 [Clostridium boliviensis]|uniref:Uncharacterized protein n=1 Tax=Clostridium boliviensis TaxID=318465 RepID=A0ABU4GK37_9CLOT|nr:hypothetical protein [Clostridium boliviensis]MDW2797979.1 hypothetical protein [Clostridium boliviensis]